MCTSSHEADQKSTKPGKNRMNASASQARGERVLRNSLYDSAPRTVSINESFLTGYQDRRTTNATADESALTSQKVVAPHMVPADEKALTDRLGSPVQIWTASQHAFWIANSRARVKHEQKSHQARMARHNRLQRTNCQPRLRLSSPLLPRTGNSRRPAFSLSNHTQG